MGEEANLIRMVIQLLKNHPHLGRDILRLEIDIQGHRELQL